MQTANLINSTILIDNVPLEHNAIKKTCTYWRRSIFISIFVSWGMFHFVRKCFSAIIPCLKSDLGFSVTQIGFLSTTFYIAYSISKIFSGYLADHSNPRYLISLGLVIAGLTNILLGTTAVPAVMAICLIVNAFFQSCAWPTCAKLLTFWCSHNERGKWWGLCGAGQNLGAGLIPVFSGFIAVYLNWRWAMYLSGLFSILTGIIMIGTIRNIPTSLGLPPVEEYYGVAEKRGTAASGSHKQSFILVMWKYILTNMPLVIFSISGLFLYVIRTAMNDWVPLYLLEEKQYESLIVANSTVWWFEIGGLLGSIVACWASDVIFQAKRLLANMVFSFGLLFSVIFFYTIPANHILFDNLAMSIIGFLVFGVQSVFGLATSEMVVKAYAGTANSFGGSICSIGAAISGLPLAMIVKGYGWDGFFYSIGVCCLLSLVFIVTAHVISNRHLVEKNEVCNATT